MSVNNEGAPRRFTWLTFAAGAALLTAVVGVVWLAMASWSAASPLTFAVATRRDVQRELALAGVLNHEETVTLGPPVPGARLVQRFVQEGAFVEAGLPLVAFEFPRAQTDVERRSAALRRAEITLQKRQASTSDDPLDIELAQVDVRTARLELEEATRIASQLVLRAPFDGRVLQIGSAIGPASGNQANVTLGRGRAPVVDVELDEFDAVQLHEALIAKITVPSLGETFEGTVLRKPTLRRLRPSGGIFGAVVGFAHPSERLTAGMTATVTIVTSRVSSVVAVPRKAIVEVSGRPHLLVRRNGQIHPTPVVVGLISGDIAEISKGVDAGSSVAVASRSELLNAALRR